MLAVLLEIRPQYATIRAHGDSLGAVVDRGSIPRWLRDGEGSEITPARAMWLENQVRCLLAGGIAETIATGRRTSPGASSDHEKALECAFLRCGSLTQAEAWLQWLSISTRETLNRLFSGEQIRLALRDEYPVTGKRRETASWLTLQTSRA